MAKERETPRRGLQHGRRGSSEVKSSLLHKVLGVTKGTEQDGISKGAATAGFGRIVQQQRRLKVIRNERKSPAFESAEVQETAVEAPKVQLGRIVEIEGSTSIRNSPEFEAEGSSVDMCTPCKSETLMAKERAALELSDQVCGVKRRRISVEIHTVSKFSKVSDVSTFVSQHFVNADVEADLGGDGRSETDSDLFTGSEQSIDRRGRDTTKPVVAAVEESDSDGGIAGVLKDESHMDPGISSPPQAGTRTMQLNCEGEKGRTLGLRAADRVWQYLCKRIVQVSPRSQGDDSEDTEFAGNSNKRRFTGHCSTAPRKTAVTSCRIMGQVVEVTTTNEAEVVDAWLLANARQIISGPTRDGVQDAEAVSSSGVGVHDEENSREELGVKVQVAESCDNHAHTCGKPELLHGDSDLLLGMDLEWRPNRSVSSDNKVALLQLSTGARCLIVQMLYLDSTPLHLSTVLVSPRVRLGGVGVKEDARKLARDHGINCLARVTDLNLLATKQLQTEDVRHMGLKQLSKVVLGQVMVKDKKITMSNWAQQHLNSNQVHYAAMDAWVSFAILHRLLEMGSSSS